MIGTLVFSACFAVLALLVAWSMRPFDRRIALGFGLLFALYLGLDDLATAMGSQAAFDVIGGEWNWSGKLYSLALSTVVVLSLRLHPEAVGLRLPQRKIGTAAVLMLLLLAASLALGLVFDPGAPSAETLAFQATMPGFAEELSYRGIAPALLLGLVCGRKPMPGIPWAVVVATALMFGAWHGLGYDDGTFSFDWIPSLYTFAGSIAYGWMRFATGSLLFPVLAHCLGNTVFQLSYLLQT